MMMYSKRFPFILGRALFFLRNFLHWLLFLFLALLWLFFLILFPFAFNVSVFSVHLFQKQTFDIFNFLVEAFIFLFFIFCQISYLFFEPSHLFIDLIEFLFNIFKENYFLNLSCFADLYHLSNCFFALINLMYLFPQQIVSNPVLSHHIFFKLLV